MGLISKMRKQKAVLWTAKDTRDEFGQVQFNDPIEIKCRWEGKRTRFINANGEEVVSEAVVYVDRELNPNGDYLWEGGLDELPSSDATPYDESEFRNANKKLPRPLRAFTKTPDLRAKEFLLVSYL